MDEVANLVCVCVVMAATTTVLAEDEVEFEFAADLFGKYIWRGQNLSDDPVFHFRSRLWAGRWCRA